jgi:type I restriction enzyme S subunit
LEGFDARFIAYLLPFPLKIINDLTYFTTVKHLSSGQVLAIRFAAPNLREQLIIADFLDEKTAAIDALIAKKKRLIELIEEKRQAAITRAVTKGLDPDVPMKDSGVEWLGEVPVHWDVMRLKFTLSAIEQGWSPSCESWPAADDEWGVMRVGCVNSVEFDPTDNKALPAGIEPLREYEIRTGDVLMSRANTRALLGSAVLVREVRPKLILCDKLYRLTARKGQLDPEFLVYVLSSRTGRYQFERDATGASSSMQNIGQDTVRNLVMGLPPITEQTHIAGALRQETTWMTEANQSLRRSINRLREYRQTLISAAVTGQLDLRSRTTRAPKTTAPELLEEVPA